MPMSKSHRRSLQKQFSGYERKSRSRKASRLRSRKGSKKSFKRKSRSRSRKGTKKGSKRKSKSRSRKASKRKSKSRSRKGTKKGSKRKSRSRSRKGTKKGSKSKSRSRSRKGSKRKSRSPNKFAQYVKKYSQCCKQNVKQGLSPCIGNMMKGASKFYRENNDLSNCSSITSSYIPNAPPLIQSPRYAEPLFGGKTVGQLKCSSLSKKNCETRNDCTFDNLLKSCVNKSEYELPIQEPVSKCEELMCNTFDNPEGLDEYPSKSQWRKWSLLNHPDKGGDSEKYAELSGCYSDNKLCKKSSSLRPSPGLLKSTAPIKTKKSRAPGLSSKYGGKQKGISDADAYALMVAGAGQKPAYGLGDYSRRSKKTGEVDYDLSMLPDEQYPEAPYVPELEAPLVSSSKTSKYGKSVGQLRCGSLSKKNCDTRSDCVYDDNKCMDRSEYELSKGGGLSDKFKPEGSEEISDADAYALVNNPDENKRGFFNWLLWGSEKQQ
jgi:hypothetical protein